MSEKYDVVVVGSGPAGYVSAIRAAQLGLKVACVEQWIDDKGAPVLGGTCLNVGCIPSKALLDSSQKYSDVIEKFSKHGINVDKPTVDMVAMLDRKNKIISQLTSGIGGLFKHNGVVVLQGRGKVLSGARVEVTNGKEDPSIVDAGSVIIAAGSVPIAIPPAPINGDTIVDSTGALEFDSIPNAKQS